MKKLISTVLKGLVLGMALSLMTGGALAAEKKLRILPLYRFRGRLGYGISRPHDLEAPFLFPK
ncbi:MAG: hypothetical protein IKD06_04130 [Clostridia bacterium]|nr:hypothetical protein [Clostridia bacterium]